MLSWFSQTLTRSSNSRGEKKPLFYGWVVVATLLVIGAISFGISVSFGVFFKPLSESFDLSRLVTSMIFSVYMILGALFAIIGGWALDRYGARILVMLMGFFTGLSLLLTSQASAPWHLFVSYSLLLAIGIGPLYTIAMSTVSWWFTEKRMLAIGIVSSGIGIGPVIIAPISAWLISSYSWHTAYFIMGIMALLIIIPCALLLRKAPVAVAALSQAKPPATNNPSVSEQEDYIGSGEFSIRQAVKTRNFWLVFAVWFFLAFCLMLVLTHIVPYAINSGITPIKAASILSLTNALSIPGRVLISKVSDSLGWKRASIGCALGMAGAMLLLIQPPQPLMFYLFAVIFGLSSGGAGPPIVAQLGNIFGLRHIGLIMGVLNTGWAIGGALGPALGGYIFDISGNYTPAFFAGMVAMLITTVLILFLRTSTTGQKDGD